jgi:hypothetical protein
MTPTVLVLTVLLKGISYGGDGCPSNSMSASYDPASGALTLLFDAFVASRGPGIANREAAKGCRINVRLEGSARWQIAARAIDYRGFAQLDAGVRATWRTRQHTQGPAPWATADLAGPWGDDYLLTHTARPPIWSSCAIAHHVNIQTDLALDGTAGASGLLTVDTLDGVVEQTIHVAARPCP